MSREASTRHVRSKEEIDVIRHDHLRVHFVMANFGAVFDCSKDQLSKGRLAEEGGAAPGLIEHAVHRSEGLAGGQMRGRERTMCRETVMQAEVTNRG